MAGLPDVTPLALDDSSLQDVDTGSCNGGKGSILSQLIESIRGTRIKSAIFLLILFILITSDVFSNVILKKMNGTINATTGCVAPYGVVIQGIMLVLSYIIVNFFIEHDMI